MIDRTMRLRSPRSMRWLSGWLIAALLFAQQGALWHWVEHLGSAQLGASAQPDPSGPPLDPGCAKCLAYAALEHAGDGATAPAIGDAPAALPIAQPLPRELPRHAPPARSRDPPRSFS